MSTLSDDGVDELEAEDETVPTRVDEVGAIPKWLALVVWEETGIGAPRGKAKRGERRRDERRAVVEQRVVQLRESQVESNPSHSRDPPSRDGSHFF